MHKHLKGHAGLHIQRVENVVGAGTPDVEGCLNGNTFWIELKQATVYQNGNCRIKFQPKQPGWLKRRVASGGKAFVLIGAKADRFLIPGHLAEEIEGTVSLEHLKSLSLCFIRPKPVEILKIVTEWQPPKSI